MKKILFILIVKILTFAVISIQASDAREPAKLINGVDFIFEKTLELKNLKNRADIPKPKIYFESQTPLKQFQDAIEKQWGFRPDVFTNAYAVENNEIYILDEADYYRRNQRCMDDSLAHELVHYFQVKYQNWDLYDESLEWEAVDIQTAFRQKFCPLIVK